MMFSTPKPTRRKAYTRHGWWVAGCLLGLFTTVWLVHGFLASSTPRQLLYQGNQHQCPDEVKKVAVVGAGSGGASSAYYLHRLAYPCKVNVTVYERENYIGGRTTTVGVYGDIFEPVELGASIFVKVNRNLVTAVNDFNLSTAAYAGEDLNGLTKGIGVWNGEKFAFLQSDASYDWWNNVKLLWKYGMSPIRTQRLMKATVNRFLGMYEAPNFPFKSISETAANLGLEAASKPSEQLLAEMNIHAPFSTDIIQAATRVNYAQNLAQIHGMEAMVSIAGEGAISVHGGNWQIFDRMLRHDNNEVRLNTKVSSVSLTPDGQRYTVKSSFRVDPTEQNLWETSSEDYDSVVLAAPLQFSNISISPPPIRSPSETPYVTLHVTLFTSPYKLSPKAYGLGDSSQVPTTILTTLPPNGKAPPFFSLSTLRAVVNSKVEPPRSEYLYKLFSHGAPSRSDLADMLEAPEDIRASSIYESSDIITWQYNKIWQSYPYLSPRVTFDDPQLDEAGRLWYTSGIEPFISTMETSSLMGKNVAQLIVDNWRLEEALVHLEKEGKEQLLSQAEELPS